MLTIGTKLTASGRFALAANRRPWEPRLGRFGRPTWSRALAITTGRLGVERGEPFAMRATLKAVVAS